MIKSSFDVMEKRLTNESLNMLADAVSRCRHTVGIDDNMIFTIVKSVLANGKHDAMPSEALSDSSLVKDYKKISKLPSILGVVPHAVMKWTIYTKDRVETRRQLLEAGFDVRNVDIIDGN